MFENPYNWPFSLSLAAKRLVNSVNPPVEVHAPPAFGMHPALRNDLVIKVYEFLDQPDVLEWSRATTTGCQNIGVVHYGSTGCIGKAFGP
jgi:hypothetical protein